MSEVPQPTDQMQPQQPIDDGDEHAQAVTAAKAIVEETIDTPEASLSPEEIAAIVDDSVYHTQSHINGRSRQSGNVTVDSMRVKYVDDKLAGRFLDEGVLEKLVVETAETIPFSRAKPDSTHGDEPITMLSYSTMNRGDPYMRTRGKYYHYPNSLGGAGSFFQFNLFLPKSVADEVVAHVPRDPSIIRQLGDEIMSRDYSEEEWAKVRPPFEQWQEENDGIARLAITRGLDEGPENAQIVEF